MVRLVCSETRGPGCVPDTSDRNIGANVTTDDRDLYLSRLEAFKAWFDREVFSLGEDSHQEAIMVLPFGDAGPAYRDMPVECVYPLSESTTTARRLLPHSYH